jgi:hypothetical protein
MDSNSGPRPVLVDRSNPAFPPDAGFIFLGVGKNIIMVLK